MSRWMIGAALACVPAAAWGQSDPHAGHAMPASPPGAGPHAGDATPATPQSADPHAGHRMSAESPADPHAGHDMAAMADHAGHAMPALLGSYGMTREASGTAWQPESSPMYGAMLHSGAWSGMAQGYATLVRSDQGGARGDAKTFVESMAMLMGGRPVGEDGRIGLRAMLSLDPLMGRRGYPLLFATGETADGVTKLVDRQHPHDFFMELAASYAHDLGDGRSVYLYAGLPGEPALGPPTFMHRVSGLDSPEAPIGHHWFDSTHITWGVLTAGYSTRTWKIETSRFTGREPDEKRWDIERPRLDSWSVRAFWNPTANLSFQASTGRLKSPEQLHPDEDEQRTTASVTYNRPLGPGANWATTVAWSLKDIKPGPSLHAGLAETALRWAERHTVYGRVEITRQAELFAHGDPLHDEQFTVGKLSLGYQYELPVTQQVRVALGGLASAYAYSERLTPAYGQDGVKSFMLYARFSYGDRAIR
jgi:hypothetical protein